MSFESSAIVDSKSLIALQADLKSLASSLHECYELLCSDLSRLSEHWQDEKFEEFEQDFRSRKEQIDEIATRYKQWAERELQQKIDQVIAIEGAGVSI